MRMMISWILSVMLVAPAVVAQEPVLAAVDGSVTSPPRRNLRIVISDEVFNELGLLADTSGVETVRCLIGRPRRWQARNLRLPALRDRGSRRR